MGKRSPVQLINDQLAQSPSHGGQVLTIDGTTTKSAVLTTGTYRISPTVDCWYLTGTTSIAAVGETAGEAYLAAGAIDFVTVHVNDDTYLAVIRATTIDGKLSVTRTAE